jgi:hypothetical protein
VYERASCPSWTSNGEIAINSPATPPLRRPAALLPIAHTRAAPTAPKTAEGSRNRNSEVPIRATSHSSRKYVG